MVLLITLKSLIQIELVEVSSLLPPPTKIQVSQHHLLNILFSRLIEVEMPRPFTSIPSTFPNLKFLLVLICQDGCQRTGRDRHGWEPWPGR